MSSVRHARLYLEGLSLVRWFSSSLAIHVDLLSDSAVLRDGFLAGWLGLSSHLLKKPDTFLPVPRPQPNLECDVFTVVGSGGVSFRSPSPTTI